VVPAVALVRTQEVFATIFPAERTAEEPVPDPVPDTRFGVAVSVGVPSIQPEVTVEQFPVCPYLSVTDIPNCEAFVKVQVSEELLLAVHMELFVGVQV
jgi:hypothetical protein